ncbi:hypothetical protein HHI36_008106 [Cryptolaemus montrouzieri]|uniref:Uncharacterized protein n=1 Tax=Cryptolaemus montrouzieri TaxID=559131 RepID=A0ABD2MS21_9CUCU
MGQPEHHDLETSNVDSCIIKDSVGSVDEPYREIESTVNVDVNVDMENNFHQDRTRVSDGNNNIDGEKVRAPCESREIQSADEHEFPREKSIRSKMPSNSIHNDPGTSKTRSGRIYEMAGKTILNEKQLEKRRPLKKECERRRRGKFRNNPQEYELYKAARRSKWQQLKE